MHGNRNGVLLHSVEKHQVLIAAHKGVFGGNIIQNTIAAFETALLSGAHILEVDAAKSTDGVFYAFHTGQEPGLIGVSKKLDAMSDQEINACCLINSNQCFVKEKVNRLDHVLEHFKHRCLINIDRGYFYLEDTIKLIQRHQMEEQVILKCAVKPKWMRCLESLGADIMFMPVIKHAKELELAKQYGINLVGAELLFDTDNSALVSEAFIAKCKAEHLLLWGNAITLNDYGTLSAGHDDDAALLKSREYGWGWFADRGFDIIQTDWTFLCAQYMQEYIKRKSAVDQIGN